MLNVLPSEIVELVFSYIPSYHLQKLIHISQVRKYVVKELYKKVQIGHKYPGTEIQSVRLLDSDIGSKYSDPNSIPMFSSVNEFLGVVDLYPSLKPREIELGNILDLLLLEKMCTKLLSNTRIVVSVFQVEDLDITTQKMLFDCIKRLECDIETRVLTIESSSTRSSYEGQSYFMKILHSINSVNICVPDLDTLLDEYSNLNVNSLTIVSPIKFSDLAQLPQSLRTLSCNLIMERGYTSLESPQNLKVLKLVAISYENMKTTINLSQLHDLEILEISEVATCTWIFPPQLKELCYTGQLLDCRGLSECCPDLRKLAYYRMNSGMNSLEEIILPSRLSQLEILTDLLLGIKHRHHQDDALFPVELPWLRSLTITGNNTSTVDLSKFRFPNLINLALIGVNITGKLPETITNLSMVDTHALEILDLCHLTNLEVLQCMNLLSDCDSKHIYCFPPSLRYLTITNLNLLRIVIESPNLKYLSLTGNKFDIIDDKNFIIPESVKELNLSKNRELQIHPDSNWHANLQSLVLSENSLRCLSNLPGKLMNLIQFRM